jgi:hypothetical protein
MEVKRNENPQNRINVLYSLYYRNFQRGEE